MIKMTYHWVSIPEIWVGQRVALPTSSFSLTQLKSGFAIVLGSAAHFFFLAGLPIVFSLTTSSSCGDGFFAFPRYDSGLGQRRLSEVSLG
jgi:hypothetical protein